MSVANVLDLVPSLRRSRSAQALAISLLGHALILSAVVGRFDAQSRRRHRPQPQATPSVVATFIQVHASLDKSLPTLPTPSMLGDSEPHRLVTRLSTRSKGIGQVSSPSPRGSAALSTERPNAPVDGLPGTSNAGDGEAVASGVSGEPQGTAAGAVAARSPQGGSAATGSRGAGSNGVSAAAWGAIRQLIERHVKYPARARRNAWEGTVVLQLNIASNGDLLAVAVSRSSGFGLLDDAAIAAVRQASPLPHLPLAAKINVPIVFRLGGRD